LSLYQRGKGKKKSWYYNFQYNGQRYNDCIGPVSKTRAKEIYARKRAEVAEGRYVSPAKKPSPQLVEFVDEYFEYYRSNRRRQTFRRHVTSWHSIEPILRSKRLDEITPLDLERYRRKRQKDGRSDTTINRELSFLRNLFNMAIAWERATENPVRKVKFAREDNGRIRFLTPGEEERLLARCKEPLKPLVITALHTGFRASELLSLTWEDVDFGRRSITVRAAYAKNGESRSVPMNDVLQSTLEEVRIRHSVSGPVFLNRAGTPYRSFRTAFENAVRHAGLVDFRFHDLRHTFASRLVMGGVDLPTVKELMGHKDIKMTLRYTHLSRDHMHAAVQVLENFGTESRQFLRQGGITEGNGAANTLKNNMLP